MKTAEGLDICPHCRRGITSASDQCCQFVGSRVVWHRKCKVAAGLGDEVDEILLLKDAAAKDAAIAAREARG